MEVAWNNKHTHTLWNVACHILEIWGEKNPAGPGPLAALPPPPAAGFPWALGGKAWACDNEGLVSSRLTALPGRSDPFKHFPILAQGSP